jgi:hypothetical protein
MAHGRKAMEPINRTFALLKSAERDRDTAIANLAAAQREANAHRSTLEAIAKAIEWDKSEGLPVAVARVVRERTDARAQRDAAKKRVEYLEYEWQQEQCLVAGIACVLGGHEGDAETGEAPESAQHAARRVMAELKEAKADTERWRQATAAGSDTDEANARAAAAVRGVGSLDDSPFTLKQWTSDARVVRERVQAQCAAQLAEALGHVGNKLNWLQLLTKVRAFHAFVMAEPAEAAPEAGREPRPGEVWRILGDEECVATDRMSPVGTRFMASLQRPGLDYEWDESCASQWEFVRGPEAAEPTPPAPHLELPVDKNVIARWRNCTKFQRGSHCGVQEQIGDGPGPSIYDVDRLAATVAALVDCEMARRAGGGGVVGGSK